MSPQKKTDFISLEQASFKAWPAQTENTHQGITLRLSNGYTKRANSANILTNQGESISKLGNLIAQYENLFQQQQLPCIFRLPSFANNQHLDVQLQQHGYQAIDNSLVMTQNLQPQPHQQTDDQIKNLSPPQWLEYFCAINQLQSNQQQAHLDILQRIECQTCFAVLFQQGAAIACGLAVCDQQQVGLFDIATQANMRGQGHATRVIHHLLQWGYQQGATQSYLQVVANNLPAVKLYQTLGYQTSIQYHYRIKH